ncbi:MAG: prenyltransferase [Pseudomonadota bacterium]|nr:prenyltransferase [Pseudomonadota bacterium]
MVKPLPPVQAPETLDSAASWRQALNPAVYLVSVLPGLGVLLLAGGQPIWLGGLAAGTFAVVLLQHGINLLNDVSDWRLGADGEKYDSWVRVHGQSTRIAALHGFVSLAAGAATGLGLLILGERLWILAVAAPLVVLGYLYNAGSRPLSYTHLGEWVTGLCYGPGVFGCLYLLAGLPFTADILWGSLSFGALAMALLLSHQPPQIETDRQAGKRSFAVRYGAQRTEQTARILYLIFALPLVVPLTQRLGGLSETGWIAAVLVALSTALVWSTVPRPPRILIPAAGLILGTLAVSWV